MFGRNKPRERGEAPIVAKIEIWPDDMKARATVIRDGVPADLEISAPYVRILLSFLKAAR